MKNKLKYNSGFSIVELIFALAIFVVLGVMAAEYIISGFEMSRINQEQEEAVKNARNTMEVMTQEIRAARQSEVGDYALDTVQPQSLIFYSDDNQDGAFERIRYFLDGRSLKKGVIIAAGSPLAYSAANESTSTIANYINNNALPIFTYYDTNNDSISDPTASKSLIRLIRIYIVTNVNPAILPGDYVLEMDAQLRNLKDNL